MRVRARVREVTKQDHQPPVQSGREPPYSRMAPWDCPRNQTRSRHPLDLPGPTLSIRSFNNFRRTTPHQSFPNLPQTNVQERSRYVRRAWIPMADLPRGDREDHRSLVRGRSKHPFLLCPKSHHWSRMRLKRLHPPLVFPDESSVAVA